LHLLWVFFLYAFLFTLLIIITLQLFPTRIAIIAIPAVVIVVLYLPRTEFTQDEAVKFILNECDFSENNEERMNYNSYDYSSFLSLQSSTSFTLEYKTLVYIVVVFIIGFIFYFFFLSESM
jgi:hypothetical protein